MYSLALLTALSTLLYPTTASPTPNLAGLSLVQVPVGKQLKNVPADIARVYQKFNKPVPANVAAAAIAAVQSGSVSANPQAYDEAYLSPVMVGTPGVTLMLDFDTGSSDLWVFSTLQKPKQQKGHSVYDPSSSSTSSKRSGESWSIQYGDGSGATGVVYSDVVKIGGVTATSQAVEAATSVSATFVKNRDNDGLVGLGFPNINTCEPTLCKTFMQSVGGSLPADLFTASLKHGVAGSYDFGFVNSTKYTGGISYAPVDTSNGFWEFTADGYSIGTKNYTLSIDAIADTGTTLIYLPLSVVKKYYSQLPSASYNSAAGGYTFTCTDTPPSLSIKISGASFTVPGSYLNYAPYTKNVCYGGLQSSDGFGVNILGDVFLKSQFVVFDVGATRIGFAAQSGK